jgi:cell division control protein 6
MSVKSARGEVVTDLDVLSEAYVPPKLVGRDGDIQSLERSLAPALKRKRPFNVWIWGPPGSGKTAVARHVFTKLREKTAVLTAYVGCRDHDTLYGVLSAIIQQLAILGAETPSAQVKLDALRRFAKDRPLITFLDDFDICVPKQRNAILSSLLGMARCGIVCLSGSGHMLDALDEKIASRLSPYVLSLSAYSEDDMLMLLCSRAGQALAPETYDDEILRQISVSVMGDARKALHCLQAAAHQAEQEGVGKISPAHIRRVCETLGPVVDSKLAGRVNAHERLILNLIRDNNSIDSPHLREAYLHACEELGATPVAPRTFTDYLAHLLHLGFIKLDELNSRGNTRVFIPGELAGHAVEVAGRLP